MKKCWCHEVIAQNEVDCPSVRRGNFDDELNSHKRLGYEKKLRIVGPRHHGRFLDSCTSREWMVDTITGSRNMDHLPKQIFNFFLESMREDPLKEVLIWEWKKTELLIKENLKGTCKLMWWIWMWADALQSTKLWISSCRVFMIFSVFAGECCEKTTVELTKKFEKALDVQFYATQWSK